MKFCAISDTHGLLPEIEPCDVLIIAGDISPLSIQGNFKLMSDWIFEDFIDWVVNLPCEEVILIAGNHDFWFNSANYTQKLLIKYASHGKITYLENQSITIYGDSGEEIKIFGTPWCHNFGYWPFMISEKLLEEKFKEIPENVDILISHDPPFGTCDIDSILQKYPPIHVGNQILSDRIWKVKPKMVISGHIHSGDHNLVEVAGTKYVNVSLLDESYSFNYKPFYFEY